jgi:hypothetical protein
MRSLEIDFGQIATVEDLSAAVKNLLGSIP